MLELGSALGGANSWASTRHLSILGPPAPFKRKFLRWTACGGVGPPRFRVSEKVRPPATRATSQMRELDRKLPPPTPIQSDSMTGGLSAQSMGCAERVTLSK